MAITLPEAGTFPSEEYGKTTLTDPSDKSLDE